jgi:hypothetical protein
VLGVQVAGARAQCSVAAVCGFGVQAQNQHVQRRIVTCGCGDVVDFGKLIGRDGVPVSWQLSGFGDFPGWVVG